MVADKDTHAGDLTPECVACAQPCVQEQTRWVCRYCEKLPDGVQRSLEALSLGGTPPAHDIRESRDSPVVGCFSPTLMSQDGLPYYLCVVRSNGIPQSGNIHHDDVDAEQRTLEGQNSSVSPQINDNAHADVSSGAHGIGDDDQDTVGDSDEDMDLEDVKDIDDNNNNNEGAHRESVGFWLQGMTSMDTVERLAGIAYMLRELDIIIPRTPSNMAQYGDEAELSDGMEIGE